MRGYPECSLVSSECNSRSLPKGGVDGSLLQGERRGGCEVAAERDLKKFCSLLL